MADYATIKLETTGPIARLTLARPDKRNPIAVRGTAVSNGGADGALTPGAR